MVSGKEKLYMGLLALSKPAQQAQVRFSPLPDLSSVITCRSRPPAASRRRRAVAGVAAYELR
jgi:hypothetical protein